MVAELLLASWEGAIRRIGPKPAHLSSQKEPWSEAKTAKLRKKTPCYDESEVFISRPMCVK